MYQIEVKRSSPDKEKIFRRYREFDELQNKLMQCFPDAQLPQLPGKILIPGKSHTKQVSKQSVSQKGKTLSQVCGNGPYLPILYVILFLKCSPSLINYVCLATVYFCIWI